MLDRIPKPVELAIFVVMALVCTLAVALSPKHDAALFFAGVPLFLISALMGFRRSAQPARPPESRAPQTQDIIS